MNMEELELGDGDCNINNGHIVNVNAGGPVMKSPCTGRWNPTKEQIRMLESFYGQGITTPTASQIQEITARLQAYGHIEGKNVFYWFQNHKARQRQKQKQHHFSYYYNHHHLHAPPPPPPPPLHHLLHPPLPPSASPNVVYAGAAQGGLRFYPPYRERVLVPEAGMAVKRAFIRDEIGEKPGRVKHNVERRKAVTNGRKGENTSSMYGGDGKETLELFPLHPTGFLEQAVNGCDIASGSTSNNLYDGGERLSEKTDPYGRNRLYIDFFHTLD